MIIKRELSPNDTRKYYFESKTPTYHPKWFVVGARVISPHYDYHGIVIGFADSYTGMSECGVVLTDNGTYIFTEITSDFREE